MALLVVAGIGAYLYFTSGSRVQVQTPGSLAPSDIDKLPPINPQNPAANDVIRPKSWTYDPLRIGYTQRWNAKRTLGDYRQERRISDTAAYRANAPFKNPRTQDIFVQSQSAYINDEMILDNNFWYKGVQPHPLIKKLGDPRYGYVKPLTRSPVKPL